MSVPRPVLILVCASVLVCGCTDAPPPATGGGIVDIAPAGVRQTYTLEDALLELDVWHVEGLINITGMTVYRIQGVNVDMDGRATSWILGAEQANESVWLVYGDAGWREITLRAPLPGQEIVMAEVLPPEDLFAAQEERIRAAMAGHGVDTADLALADGIYTVTVRSESGLETLAFRADTGEVLVSD